MPTDRQNTKKYCVDQYGFAKCFVAYFSKYILINLHPKAWIRGV